MTINKDTPSLSRYSYGVTVLKHRNKFVTTSLGSDFDSYLNSMEFTKSRKGKVPAMVQHRPDLISNIFYDTPGYWWYVMQYNGITDPFEQLNPGDDIDIPEL